MALRSSAALSYGKLWYLCISLGEPDDKTCSENSQQKADGGGSFLISEGGLEDTSNTDAAWCFSHGNLAGSSVLSAASDAVRSRALGRGVTQKFIPLENIRWVLFCKLQIASYEYFYLETPCYCSLTASLKGSFAANALVSSSLLWTGKILLCRHRS